MSGAARDRRPRWPLAVPAGVALVHVALLLVVARDGTITVVPIREAIAGIGPAVAAVVPQQYGSVVRAVTGADWFPVVVLETLLAVLVGASLLAGKSRRRTATAFVAVLAILTTVVAVGFGSGWELWLIVGVVVAVLGLLAYGLHRYERVVLGFVDGGSAT